MKTVRYLISLFGILGMVLSFTACSNKNDSNTTATTGYYWANGQCYASNTGQIVTTTLCNNTCYQVNGTWYSSTTGQVTNYANCNVGTTTANQCYYNQATGYYYSTLTNQPVAASACTGTGTNQCVGLYYAVGMYGAYQAVQCNGTNCRGYTLMNATTGQSQYCQ